MSRSKHGTGFSGLQGKKEYGAIALLVPLYPSLIVENKVESSTPALGALSDVMLKGQLPVLQPKYCWVNEKLQLSAWRTFV